MSTTVHQAFRVTAARHGAQPFLCILPETARAYGVEAGELGYAQAADAIETLRAAYARAGYGHGHRAGLLLENRPAFFLHWFALNALGVSVVPINPDLRAAELEYLTGHSEIALAVALPERHADLLAAAKRAGRELRVMGPDDMPPASPFAAPLAGSEPDVLTECALLYTSGTTGRPKGCILPNRYFLHAGGWYARIGGLAALRPGQERMLTPLPLVHMNAMAYSAMAMVLTGGCLIPLDRFHPKTWWDSVRDSRATVLHYLGVMPAILMKAEPSANDPQRAIRFGFGAGVDRKLHQPFEARFGFPLLEAWAMTETGAGAVIIANREPRHIGSSCFGSEEEDVLVRIVSDAGDEAATGEPGELLVRHAGDDPRYGFFAGYLKDEEATAQAWEDGWFHTGDIVRREADGALRFVDRKKNVIRRSGENISAVEVESVLMQHPLVKAVAVAAVPDPVRGDEVLACVVPDKWPVTDAEMTEAARSIVQWSLEQLAYYKAPGYVAFVDSLPLTTTNKIQRGEMKALAPTLPGRARCVDTCAMKKRPQADAAPARREESVR
ncbi:Long-chain-fatty-acid--CoA ligase [Achromobacter denitrificans]|uniref:AMP-binding protein n=1 Tax=Achromobacter denitrificans TaxID=32002 RepID=UPI0007895C59|nr:AMP-binding protein [Achromobacter denitrificans]OLU08732.1 ATP-dependent acyl-CoA ligase [Achromobacter denitrificans]QKH45101.1 AMP-binding protein [Achromobacter denitrificans]QKH53557.1 AMP-binding protein [Achromobacter denitrificans]CAB3691435.1 Long-chain-fatty-acid--CoA ligase [Achromobacter denitrificans]SUW34399.1 Long-chain-fatty-acid--CoA ligase [Achromobacter denitrificans]